MSHPEKAKWIFPSLVGVLFLPLLLALFGEETPPAASRAPAEVTMADVATTTPAAKVETVSIATTTATTTYKVVSVTDGDTISLDGNDETITVRLLGIDTPETVHPSRPVECFGQEASAKAKEILTDQMVTLEFDETQGQRDKYGRLLAYLFLSDSTHFNEYMVRQGYAYEYTYRTPYRYQAAFQAAEQEARAEKRGLWAPGVCEATTKTTEFTAPRSATTPPPAPVQSAAGYTCSANIYNCSDFKTHAEAQSVYEACGGVGYDIHHLDSDQDGQACETLP